MTQRELIIQALRRAGNSGVCLTDPVMPESHSETPPPEIVFAELLHALRDVYKPEGCGIWLYAPHKSWKGLNAVSMIEDGRLEEVRAEIERLATGAAS